MRLLLAWIGNTDLRASEMAEAADGPIARAVEAREFDRVLVISNYPKEKTKAFAKWLTKQTTSAVQPLYATLSSPTNFGEIYEAAVNACEVALADGKGTASLTFHLSPGTPAMQAVWIILGKTRFPAEFIQSSPQRGVETVSIPFDISADFLPDLLRAADQKLVDSAAASAPEAATFGDILYRSGVMKTLVARAKKAALRDVPVLIEGESGTGKELLARAIHGASARKAKPFVAVNCGAIPRELVESQLFGHEKGAFTGADRTHEGFFEQANGGTIFLDEIGELPLDAQVKLLRVLQENEVTRLGSSKKIRLDLRVMAATNRSLVAEVSFSRFREDLFFRLAVAVLNIPPVRERQGDLSLLIDRLLEKVDGGSGQSGSKKKLSAGARNVLLNHGWPGNVRELQNTLQRIVVWGEGATIDTDEAREALISFRRGAAAEVLNRPLGAGFDLKRLLDDVAVHYLTRAMEESKGNKTEAARLVGLPSYQTLTNWLERYGVALDS
jgi:transcriptional regulator with PAS, ATPase and Fis domain